MPRGGIAGLVLGLRLRRGRWFLGGKTFGLGRWIFEGEAPVGVDFVGWNFFAVGVLVGDDHVAARGGPFAVLVEAGIGADGGDDLAWGGFDDAGAFEKEAEGEVGFAGAPFE